MTYNVNVESIAIDVNDKVRSAILARLETYDFPYVSTVPNKVALRELFKKYFKEKHTIDWLKVQLESLVTSRRGIVPIAMTETNRLHTGGLADVLLSEGKTQCTTVHSYGDEGMSPKCRMNLEGKTLDIRQVLTNSFPSSFSGLNSNVSMIPQHVNCRHVMAPLET